MAEFRAARDKVGYARQAIATRPRFDAYDDWDMTDPLPFLCWWGSAIIRKVGTIVRRRMG